MTNDTTTLNGALRELGELMATNLETMGVEEVSADDGLMTLAGKVLDVEPSIKGLELSLNLDLSSDKHIVDENEQFTLNATFIGSYDDETQEDVDLFGVITGATILFKDVSNDVVLCSRVTGLDGSIEVSLVNDFNEDVEIMAIFEGTENFDSCNSDSINLYQIRSMVLSSDKEELPKEAGETVLMTATVVGNVNGCSVKWYNDDTDELFGIGQYGCVFEDEDIRELAQSYADEGYCIHDPEKDRQYGNAFGDGEYQFSTGFTAHRVQDDSEEFISIYKMNEVLFNYFLVDYYDMGDATYTDDGTVIRYSYDDYYVEFNRDTGMGCIYSFYDMAEDEG